MSFINYAAREINVKIVFYGPGLCGKTTNLAWIHDHFEGGSKGKMISLATEGDRTIFFDLLPLEIGSIRGIDVTLQLYTVPGQVFYNATRRLVLKGADAVEIEHRDHFFLRAVPVDAYGEVLYGALACSWTTDDGSTVALSTSPLDNIVELTADATGSATLEVTLGGFTVISTSSEPFRLERM